MKYFILLGLFLLPYLGKCQNWISVSKGETYDFLYNNSRYTRTGNLISFWVKTVYTGSELADYKQRMKKMMPKKSLQYSSYEYSLIRYQIDCSSEKFRILNGSDYNTEGKVIDSHSSNEDEAKWIDITPESISELLLIEVCSKLQ